MPCPTRVSASRAPELRFLSPHLQLLHFCFISTFNLSSIVPLILLLSFPFSLSISKEVPASGPYSISTSTSSHSFTRPHALTVCPPTVVLLSRRTAPFLPALTITWLHPFLPKDPAAEHTLSLWATSKDGALARRCWLLRVSGAQSNSHNLITFFLHHG